MAAEQKVIRKLRAILSADVKGYSLLMTNDEAFSIKTLKEYRKIFFEITNILVVLLIRLVVYVFQEVLMIILKTNLTLDMNTYPNLSVSYLLKISKYKNQAHTQYIIDAMRKAGFPE